MLKQKSKKRSACTNEDDTSVMIKKGASKSQKTITKIVDSPEESESDSLDDEAYIAVEHATNIIASMRSLEAVGDVLQEVKNRVQCLIYNGEVKQLFSRVLLSEEGLNPFKKQERSHLNSLFECCAIESHETFKDRECTLTSRKEVCGASTTLLCDCGGEGIALIMTWYWQPDEEQGFAEEFSLVHRPCSSSESGAESDGDADIEHTVMEGTRTLGSGLRAQVNLPVLREIHALIKRKLSLQTLLRFLVLCSRAECAKCQDRVNSVTHGFDPAEDAEDMCHFLAGFVVDPAAEHAPEESASRDPAARPRPAARRGSAAAARRAVPAAAPPPGKKSRRG
jgi:hypothetical protein